MEDEHFEALQDATSEWLNGFEKLDMHIPYFTHPDLVDDDGNEIPHSPFDVFHSGSIPNDISTFNYIEHGFDHTNPQERNRVKFGDTTLFLSGVKPVSVCPRCFMKLSRDDVDNGDSRPPAPFLVTGQAQPLAGFYYDDGALGGSSAQVLRSLQGLCLEGPRVGLHFATAAGKNVLIRPCPTSTVAVDAFPDFVTRGNS